MKEYYLYTFLLGAVALIAVLYQYHSSDNLSSEIVIDVKQRNNCSFGSFLLTGMSFCHHWLTCSDIFREVTDTQLLLGEGTQKIVREGVWRGHAVALNYLKTDFYVMDFKNDLKLLSYFSKEPKVNQLIGWCIEDLEFPIIITEKHPLGSPNKLENLFEKFPNLNTITFRFMLCVQYLEILAFLHTSTEGPFVMCDSNDPEKALSQLLLTNNLTLVINDMDAVPQVIRHNGTLIKCGHAQLFGDLVAPEQLWPFENLPFNDTAMHSYDEKVDIWKIPDVCNYLIGNGPGSSILKLHLFNIHSKCKETDPIKRPTVETVLESYLSIKKMLEKNFIKIS
ncbi:unnamed protein product [Lymnaea stagnalis]|uniref:Protein kinase domain-containing protein n=1 Tax=Lymnaea stagnalis TaxID=6523 RepID=A0AAV2HGI0_LYMST